MNYMHISMILGSCYQSIAFREIFLFNFSIHLLCMAFRIYNNNDTDLIKGPLLITFNSSTKLHSYCGFITLLPASVHQWAPEIEPRQSVFLCGPLQWMLCVTPEGPNDVCDSGSSLLQSKIHHTSETTG